MLSIIRIPNEPIVIVSFNFGVDRYLDQQSHIDAEVHRVATEYDCPIFKITDLSRINDMTYGGLSLWLTAMRTTPPYRLSSACVRPAVVSAHPMMQVVARKVKQHFNIEFPVFATLDQALYYARAEHAGCLSRSGLA
ncbi:MAG: hypothetical protein JXQ72_16940 [Anaerolineae bacterium]|nr:hypothetical protein [Anaerolineae bacterium]